MNADDLAELRRLADGLPAILEAARAGRLSLAQVAELVSVLGDVRAQLVIGLEGPLAILHRLPVPEGRA